MFVDRVDIYCKAGDGGDGCASFRREAHVPRGGPNGGDGGKGGDVIVLADENVSSLGNIIGHKHWNAERGGHGSSSLKTGKCGEDAIIMVPPGTLVIDSKRGNLLRDMKQSGDRVVVAKGGKFEKGGVGELRDISLELKLIADVGLVGKPNAGKSTLLSRLSKAHPEIAAYPFTTKYPNLGLVRVGFDHQFVMADIPGLIEGAHAGVGLGHEFLRHVERTRVLVHLVEPSPMDQTDPIQNYRQIREEMRLYDASLMDRPEIIVVTKSELPDAEPVAELLGEELGRPVMQISSATGSNLDKLVRMIIDELEELEVEA